MKIDGVVITHYHVGCEIIIIEEIDAHLPQGFVTTIDRVDYGDDTIRVKETSGALSWLSVEDAKNLSFKDKEPDLFTMNDKSTPIDVEDTYEHRKSVAKKINTTFNTMVALKKELASAEYLYNEAIKEGDTLSLVIEGGTVSGKIKVSYQPEVIVFSDE
jgi:hypothetical protein